MSYLSNIKRLKLAGNLGGLVTLMIARKAEIVSIADPVNGVIYGDITFLGDAGFVSWEATTESLGIDSRGNSTREGFTMNPQLPFTLPKMRGELISQLQQATEDEFVVLIKNANGKTFLFGNLSAPVQFEYDQTSGRSHNDLNHYKCRFYYNGPNNLFEYQGAIAAAPAGAAPAIVKFNGVAIASLAAGETLEILSDYSFTEYFTIAP